MGENLKKALEEVFAIYTSDNVINGTIGSKNPKIRFHGGSESADQQVACAVAQTNMGKQYLVKTLEVVDITPGCTMTQQVSKMDYEKKQDKNRKQCPAFKKRRRQLAKIRSNKNGTSEAREGIVYQSGSALT